MMTVNFTWPAAAMSAVADRLRRQGHGRIIVLSSVAGFRVRRSNFIYGSAKAGLDGFAQGLSESLRGTGVTVHIVRPGFVRTKMTSGRSPAPFAVDPSRVASDIERGVARGQTVIWSPGLLRWVFSALRMLPESAVAPTAGVRSRRECARLRLRGHFDGRIAAGSGSHSDEVRHNSAASERSLEPSGVDSRR